MGLAKRTLGKNEEAIEYFLRAIQLDSRDAETHVQIALVYRAVRKFDMAVMYMLRAADRAPTPQNFTNCGKLLIELKEAKAAISYFQRAIDLDPNFTPAHYELSLAYALSGQWDKFFGEYEWRIKYFDDIAALHDKYPMPLWDGQPIDGKTLLVHGEQGQGDWIQFVRYVEPIRKQGVQILLHCPPSLMRLFASLADGVYNHDEAPPAADYHCSVMSLPFLTTL
jgi:tetratricopeptide (TPR) repeat protein